jgi:hypothetical protein
VELIGIGEDEHNEADIEAVKDELRSIGVVFGGTDIKTMEVGLQPSRERIEDSAMMGPLFFRCVAKICFNYVAAVCGAENVLGPAFDPIRRFIMDGASDERLVQAYAPGTPEPSRKPGDAYRVGFRRRRGGIQGHLRLLTGYLWVKQLTIEPDGIPMAAATHEYDLDALIVRQMFPPTF